MNENKKTIFADLYEWIQEIFSNVKVWFVDHYHILFRSAADNHMRIHECVKNEDGSYQCNIKFASYTDLKKYQKKLRRLTISLSSAVAMVIVAVIVAPYVLNPNRSSASTFLFKQAGWTTGTATGTTANYPDNNNGFTDYSSKNNIEVANAGADLTITTPTILNTGDDADYTTDLGSNTGFYVDATSKNLTLKKPIGASCSSPGNDECLSASCVGSTCVLPCSASTACGETCGYNGVAYASVTSGGSCWMKSNINSGIKVAGSLTLSNGNKWCLNDLESICIARGGLYDTTRAGSVCPTGWELPNQAQWTSLGTAGANSIGITNNTGTHWASSPYSGENGTGFYWNSLLNSSQLASYNGSILNASASASSSNGFAVRCVKSLFANGVSCNANSDCLNNTCTNGTCNTDWYASPSVNGGLKIYAITNLINNWSTASAYCAGVGGDLPTMAQASNIYSNKAAYIALGVTMPTSAGTKTKESTGCVANYHQGLSYSTGNPNGCMADGTGHGFLCVKP